MRRRNLPPAGDGWFVELASSGASFLGRGYPIGRRPVDHKLLMVAISNDHDLNYEPASRGHYKRVVRARKRSSARSRGCANSGHLSAAIGDLALAFLLTRSAQPRRVPMSPISGAHQERAGRAADVGLRRVGASELSEAGKCLVNGRAALFERRSERRGEHVATIGLLD